VVAEAGQVSAASVEPPQAGWQVCHAVRSGQVRLAGWLGWSDRPRPRPDGGGTNSLIINSAHKQNGNRLSSKVFIYIALPCPVVSVYYEGDASQCDDSGWSAQQAVVMNVLWLSSICGIKFTTSINCGMDSCLLLT